MFSTGQLIFAALFIVLFVIVIAYAYRKDKKSHAKTYKGVQWIMLGFASFILILMLINYFLKN